MNILGLQIYPDLGSVTDDLVVKLPDSWSARQLVELVEMAGGREVTVSPCSAYDLQDQPTQWLAAARALVDDPGCLPAQLTRLLGPRTSLSATEQVRVAALTDLAAALDSPSPMRTDNAVVEYDDAPDGVRARVGDGVVGAATFVLVAGGPAEGALEVAPAWRRMGVGRRLLRRLCMVAAAAGVDDLVLVAPPTEEGVAPLLAASGLRGRIRLTDDGLRVQLSLAGLRPVVNAPAGLD